MDKHITEEQQIKDVVDILAGLFYQNTDIPPDLLERKGALPDIDIDFKNSNINSFKECLVDGHSNVVDMEKYKIYKNNKFE